MKTKQKEKPKIPIKYIEFHRELNELTRKYGIELYVIFHTEDRFITKKRDILLTAYSTDRFDNLITDALHKRFLDKLKGKSKRQGK